MNWLIEVAVLTLKLFAVSLSPVVCLLVGFSVWAYLEDL